jgi:CRISPR type I-E-associated protein CasB/Cse2
MSDQQTSILAGPEGTASAAIEVGTDRTPTQRWDASDPSEVAFVGRLRDLRIGDLATLKRNAGNTMAEARGCSWFWRLLDQGDRGRDREIFFLVASLFAISRRGEESNCGGSAARLSHAAGVNSDAIERRFLLLLDADFDRSEDGLPAGGELSFRLRQMVRLAASKGIGFDWAQLLHDLREWRRPGKPVQKRWAADFFPAATGGTTTDK